MSWSVIAQYGRLTRLRLRSGIFEPWKDRARKPSPDGMSHCKGARDELDSRAKMAKSRVDVTFVRKWTAVLGDGHFVSGQFVKGADNYGLLGFDMWWLNCLLLVWGRR